DPFGCVAACVPLCIGITYLIYMMVVMKRGFGWQPALLVGLLIVLSPSWHRVFRIGHPDHHCLIALLLLFAVGPWIPAARSDGSPGLPGRRAAFLSGLAMGAAIWVAVEPMVFWLAMVAALWAACTFGPPDERRSHAQTRFAWNFGALLVVAAAHVIENWPDLSSVAADKVSLLYVILVAVGFLVPGRAAGAAHRGSGLSLLALLVALAVLTIWVAVRPDRVFGNVNRPEFIRWSANVMELRPLLVRGGAQWSLSPLHRLMGYLPYALPALLVFFLRYKPVPRVAKVALVLLAPAITVLAALQLRWIDHFDLVVIPTAVIGVWGMVKAWDGRLPRVQASGPADAASSKLSPAALFVGIAILLALALPSMKTVVTYGIADAVEATAGIRRTDFAAQHILAYEREHLEANPRRRAILSEDAEGPPLLYWTGLPVVATPYHRALDGLLEAARFFAERDPARAREQLDHLGVRYVVMPPRAHEQLMQFEQMAFGELRSFEPPTESLDESGRLKLKLNYRPWEAARTMAYRLVMEPDSEVIPGVRLIVGINEGAKTVDGRPMKTGLLYVVNDLPSAGAAGRE
ncbi:MAG TPA: hypothetical protein VMV94_09605, partial [Phycisphaerae bacterium]|nr:hypothetical protein [Phycisphaerae bacterium]